MALEHFFLYSLHYYSMDVHNLQVKELEEIESVRKKKHSISFNKSHTTVFFLYIHKLLNSSVSFC